MKTSQKWADKWFEDFLKKPPLIDELRDWFRERITELRQADKVDIDRLHEVVRTLRLHARNFALDGDRLLAGFSWTAQQQAEAVAAFDAETERLVNGNND